MIWENSTFLYHARLKVHLYRESFSNFNRVDNPITDSCSKYRSKWPTVRSLFQNSPPEYYPMLGLGIVLFSLTSLLLTVDVKLKHLSYLKNGHFKLSSRVIMILTAYWLFALTGKKYYWFCLMLRFKCSSQSSYINNILEIE